MFQLYIVIEPVNSNISRSVHLSFWYGFSILIYPMMKTYFLTKIRWFGYTFTAIGLGTAFILLFYNEISLRPGDYMQLDILLLL